MRAIGLGQLGSSCCSGHMSSSIGHRGHLMVTHKVSQDSIGLSKCLRHLHPNPPKLCIQVSNSPTLKTKSLLRPCIRTGILSSPSITGQSGPQNHRTMWTSHDHYHHHNHITGQSDPQNHRTQWTHHDHYHHHITGQWSPKSWYTVDTP